MAGKTIIFKCAFPPIQSAIKIDGQGGARIQLDIPESEMGNFIEAMTWRGKVLVVGMELAAENYKNLTGLDGNDDNAEQTDEGPKKRPVRVGRRRS